MGSGQNQEQIRPLTH